MRNVRNAQSGFSLIELMVVVGIIGILAAVAVPQFQKFQAKARTTESVSMLGSLNTGEQAFYAQWQIYTADLSNAGLSTNATNLRYDVGFPVSGTCTGYPGAATGAPPETAANTLLSGTLGASAANLFVYQAIPTKIASGSPSGYKGAANIDQCKATGTIAYIAAAYGDPKNTPVAGYNTDVWTINNSGTVSQMNVGY